MYGIQGKAYKFYWHVLGICAVLTPGEVSSLDPLNLCHCIDVSSADLCGSENMPYKSHYQPGSPVPLLSSSWQLGGTAHSSLTFGF